MTELNRVHKWNELAGIPFKRHRLGDRPDVYMDLIAEEYAETLEAFESGNVPEVVDGATDLLVVATGLLHTLRVNAEDALGRVNDSNFSKYDTTVEDAEISVLKYTGDERYKDVHYVKTGDYYIIWGTKTDSGVKKILKSHKYQPPDFSGLLTEVVDGSN